jgi:hypothetical protein
MLGAALTLSGCGGDEPEPKAPSEPAVTSGGEKDARAPSAPDGEAGKGPEERVTLTTAGEGETELLRLEWPTEGTEEVTTTTQMTVTNQAASSPPSTVRLPPMEMRFSIRYRPRTSDGNLAYGFEITDVAVADDESVDEATRAAAVQAFEPLRGTTGEAVVTPRGLTRHLDFDVPKGLSPDVQQIVDNARQALRQLTPPLPEEPVAVGARWKTVDDVDMAGMSFVQTTVYTLEDRGPKTARLSVEVDQRAKSQTLKIPSLPPEAEVHIDRLDSSGSGTYALRLDSARAGYKMEMAMSLAATIRMQGNAVPFGMDMELATMAGPEEEPEPAAEPEPAGGREPASEGEP